MQNIGEFINNSIELVAVASFAVSGAMTAVAKRLDAFGVIFIGIVSALGGGVIRDILLGALPPMMFRNYSYIITAVIASLAVFLVAYFFNSRYHRHAHTVDTVNNIIDAVGLGLFTATGIKTAIDVGFCDNAFFCIFLGVVTGVGGGITRDIMINTLPAAFCRHIYVVASIFGAVVCYILERLGIEWVYSLVITVMLVVVIRVLATKYRWNFPRV